MTVQHFDKKLAQSTAELLVLGLFTDQDFESNEFELGDPIHSALAQRVKNLNFKGKKGQKVTLDTVGHLSVQRVLLVGLGSKESWSGVSVRDAAALAAQEAFQAKLSSVLIAFPSEPSQGQELVCGFKLGEYRFTTFLSEDETQPKHEIKSLLVTGDCTESAMSKGETLASAVCLARDLVNEPPNVCTPERLADVAQSFSSSPNVKVHILNKAEIEAKGMGGVIGVSQGATREPKFIHVHYTPSTSMGSIALIGKGLTFDSGGLSLKPPKSQEMMHIDMAGSAAVLGAMSAIVRLQPEIEVHAIVGACENMPDGNSYRPSDILTMYSGKTVEVLNTDAEGRLVLADALHYATELKPDAMINLATLTGACMVGLGSNYCGLFSDHDGWAEQVEAAGKSAGEKLWRLPLDEGLMTTLKSKRADIRNIGGPWGGAITAALFLKQFKGDITWAHLDIAGPTTSSSTRGSISEGATGFGVLTLIELVEQFRAPESV